MMKNIIYIYSLPRDDKICLGFIPFIPYIPYKIKHPSVGNLK